MFMICLTSVSLKCIINDPSMNSSLNTATSSSCLCWELEMYNISLGTEPSMNIARTTCITGTKDNRNNYYVLCHWWGYLTVFCTAAYSLTPSVQSDHKDPYSIIDIIVILCNTWSLDLPRHLDKPNKYGMSRDFNDILKI